MVFLPPEDQTSSPVMERIGQWVRGLLVKFWIWLVAIMLFIFGIQGSEVVIFRIMYMVLFLVFTITFQVSLCGGLDFNFLARGALVMDNKRVKIKAH